MVTPNDELVWEPYLQADAVELVPQITGPVIRTHRDRNLHSPCYAVFPAFAPIYEAFAPPPAKEDDLSPLRAAASRSDSTISSTSCWNVRPRSQPRTRRALVASPLSRSTSAGR